MSRDHKKLRVFHDAHAVATSIYRQTRRFPQDEVFGLRAQMRRAAVSVSCNIVERNARRTARDYLRFLHVALGSACELQYLVELATELELATEEEWVHGKTVRTEQREKTAQVHARTVDRRL